MKLEQLERVDLYDRFKEHLKTPIILSNMNFKGGSSKTATTVLQAYELSLNGFKVLTIDNDAQANLTEFLLQEREFEYDISDVLLNGVEIEKAIISATDNLDIIPSSLNYVYLDDINRSSYSNKHILNSFKRKIDSIKHQYDFIFIDVPPSININIKLALEVCTDINIVVQTKMPSFFGSEKLISWLNSYLHENSLDINLIGVIRTLTDKNKLKHKEVYNLIYDHYKDLTYNNFVDYSDRIDYFSNHGIDENEYWSKVVLRRFNDLNYEMLERICE